MSNFISQTSLPISTPDIVLREVACDSSVIVGDWVRFNASNVLIKAQADSTANSHIVGIVEEKITSIKCNVRLAGVTKEGVVSGLSLNTEYFLSASSAGAQTSVVPVGSGNLICRLGLAFSATRFLVRMDSVRLKRAT